MSDPLSPLLPLPFAFDDTHHRLTRDAAQILSKFLKTFIYNSTVPLSFEIFSRKIFTLYPSSVNITTHISITLTHSVVETTDEPSFSIPFTSPLNLSDSFRKNINPSNIYIPIGHIFTTFLNNFSKKNNILPQHVSNSSSIYDLLQKESFF